MKRLTNITFFFLIFSFPIYGQYGISGSLGVGSYAMNSLKELNTSNQIIINGDKTITMHQLENFPMYSTLTLNGFIEISNDSRFSGGIQYLTTGSRLYVEDYSGKISFDIITSAIVLNSTYSKTVYRFPWCSMGFFAGPQLLLGKTNFKYHINIYPNFSESSNTSGNSINLGLTAGIYFRKCIKRFEYSFETGYYYDIIKGSLKANNEYEIQNPESGKGLKNNWSGIRLTMGVGYFIKLQ